MALTTTFGRGRKGGFRRPSTVGIQSFAGIAIANISGKVSAVGNHQEPITTSYANPGGTGDRRLLIMPTTSTWSWGAGNRYNLIDGTAGNNCYFGANIAGRYLEYDFCDKVIVDEITWKQSGIAAHGTWKLRGSNDGSIYTDVGATFTLGSSATQVISFSGNITAYRKYRLEMVSGSTTDAPWLYEIEFKVSLPVGKTTNTSYDNWGGTGDRTGFITVTASPGLTGSGSPNDLVDGSMAGEFYFSNVAVAGHYLVFDFGSAKIVDALRFYQSGAFTQGVWKIQGSNNGTDYDDLTGSFDLGLVTSHVVNFGANVTAYRYYRMLGVSGGTNSSPHILEFEFRISSDEKPNSSAMVNSGLSISDGLRVAYLMNEGSGTNFTDRSGGGWNAPISGTPSWVADPYGTGVSFNGLYGTNTTDSATQPTEFTLVALVKATGNGGMGFRGILARQGGFLNVGFDLFMDGWDGKSQFWVSAKDTAERYVKDLTNRMNEWVHLVATGKSGGMLRLYVNGVETGTPVALGTLTTGQTMWTVGTTTRDYGYGFIGIIDHAYVYTRELSASDVAVLADDYYAPFR